MCKRSRSRTTFGSQRSNGLQSLLKSSLHHFYIIVPLIWDKLNCKRLLLVRFELLALFLNTMTTDDKISPHNSENFAQQIQMQLSQEPKIFYGFSFPFLKSTSKFEYFEEKEECHSLSISENIDSERGGYLNAKKVPFQNTFRQPTS